jgi:hypothetical protein
MCSISGIAGDRLSVIRQAISVPRRIMLSYKLNKRLKDLDNIKIEHIRKNTLRYVESMRIRSDNYGKYLYSYSQKEPVLYASVYAALTRHLYGDLEAISNNERKEWISYIKSHQANDGLFKDQLLNNKMAPKCDWWGWRHLTLHVIMALTALDATVEKKFTFLEPFKNQEYAIKWLEDRDWLKDPANVSNEIQNYVTILQYARDFQDVAWAGDSIQTIQNWLDEKQDLGSGLWGNRFDDSYKLSNGVQTGYHLWLLYFYEKRKINYVNNIVDSILNTQSNLGGFGVPPNSSACEDIDSIDPLVRLYFQTDHRHAEVRKALERALPWVLVNMNKDGGFVFRRFQGFEYGHQRMYSRSDESAMFPTWFRTLSLAYLSKILQNSLNGRLNWQFLHCPGHQFWID